MSDLAAIAAEFGDDPGAASGEAAIFRHSAAIWGWKSTTTDAPAAWFFLTIDGNTAATIGGAAGVRSGFGSICVKARIGGTDFQTSIFRTRRVAAGCSR